MTTPPHSIEAEESLLGAMLLARDGVRVGLDLCSGADFYRPAHVAIFDTIETLYHEASAIDTVTVTEQLRSAGLLGDVGGKAEVGRIMASTPASANAVQYAEIVADCAAARRAIGFAESVDAAAYNGDLETVDRLLRAGLETVAAPGGAVEPGIEVSELTTREYPERVLVPGLLNRGDRVIITGGEGRGKSVLCRQVGVMVASGLHPFDFSPVPRLRVLIVDLENDVADVADSVRQLLAAAGDRYTGNLWIKFRPQGMNLQQRRDARWLDALCAHHRPDLLVIGPLYKAYRGSEGQSKSSEEAAERVTAEFDELRVRYDCGLLIEAHAPHGEGGDRARWRPRGSTLWLGWPEFGFGLSQENETLFKLVTWRGSRRRGQDWPRYLREGQVWPWELPSPVLEDVQ